MLLLQMCLPDHHEDERNAYLLSTLGHSGAFKCTKYHGDQNWQPSTGDLTCTGTESHGER